MTPTRKILLGDCRETLKQIPDNSVHCVITSPPYWGLRRYGSSHKEIGQEKTPSEFIAVMVDLFREVRRVLRPDGTLWLNMGDTMTGSGRSGGDTGNGTLIHRGKTNQPEIKVKGLKPKNILMIPHRVAIALQDDGWIVRMDNIWHKPNAMPESAEDRPSKVHEYLFLMSKTGSYFYDEEPIREPVTGNANPRGNGVNPKAKTPGKNSREFQDRDPLHTGDRKKQNESFSAAVRGVVSSTRRRRSVWSIATQPYDDAHFATFPSDLVRPCVLAGTSERGCCGNCGIPYERIVELGEPDLEHQRACGGDLLGGYNGKSKKDYTGSKAQDASATKARILAGMRDRKTVGWKKNCDCSSAEIVPCTVLDIFAGSGTTGQVAGELGRNFIGCELYEKFLPMIERRTAQPGLMLA